MSEDLREPKVGDSVYFPDGDSLGIVEVLSKEDDGTWDVTVQEEGEEPADVYISWNVSNSRWEAEGE